MNCKLLLLGISLVCLAPTASTAQTSLIAVTDHNPPVKYITDFNYSTGAYDTVVAFQGNISYNFDNTIDAFNGRYFLLGKLDTASAGGLLITNLDEKNIINKQFKSTLPIDISSGSMEYDMYLNKIFCLAIQQNKRYLAAIDLKTDSISLFTTELPISGSTYYGRQSAYDPYSNELIYIHSDTNTSVNLSRIIVLDTKSGKVKSDRLVAHTASPLYINFNLLTLKYYGFIQGWLAEYNPNTGKHNSIKKILTPAIGLLNQQQSSIDARTGTFLFPYYIGNTCSLSTTNIKVGMALDTLLYDKTTNQQRFYGKYDPITIFRDNHLITTYGKAYQWYRDGQPIPGATSQTYVPNNSGVYKAEVTFLSNRTAFSNEISFIPESITHQKMQGINFYPNPVKDRAILNFNNPSGNRYTLEIFNSTGQKTAHYTTTGSSFTINATELAAGMYYYYLSNTDGQIIIGKFITE